MKVTFAVYNHQNNSISLVKSEVKGNRPKQDIWEQAAEKAKNEIAETQDKKLTEWLGRPYRGTYSISFVLKGWVDYEENAPTDL